VCDRREAYTNGDRHDMEVTVKDFKCPACGHLIGPEEYEHVCQRITKLIETTAEGRVENIRRECDNKIQELQKLMQRQEEKYRQETNSKVNERVQLIIDEETQAARLEGQKDYEEQYRRLCAQREQDNRQRESEYQRRFAQLEQENQHMKKILESIPPELRGTSGEINLYADLHKAFPDDLLVLKKVGREMPDIIQTVVTENGERLTAVVLWDTKTGEKITTEDIEKAKRYKEIYNTDYCTIVSKTYLTGKHSKNLSSGYIGKRDGILLVHESVAIGVAEQIRNWIIERTRLEKQNNGRVSKEIKLYDYVTSSSRFRKMREKAENKLKLEESIRKQEDYNRKVWNEQRRIINESVELDKEDLKTISEITQVDEENKEAKEDRDTEEK
jgi:Uncharacterized protein conserved in bacteria (DUF2130)